VTVKFRQFLARETTDSMCSSVEFRVLNLHFLWHEHKKQIVTVLSTSAPEVVVLAKLYVCRQFLEWYLKRHFMSRAW
jgi:hypothetical protein